MLGSNQRRGRVRFAPLEGDHEGVDAEIVGPLLQPASEMSREEKTEIWWTRRDYTTFRNNVRFLAREIRCRDDNKYSQHSMNYNIVVVKGFLAYQRGVGPSETEKRFLKHWAKCSHFSRRGIERWCINGLDELREDRIRGSISAVLGAQAYANTMNLVDKEELIKSSYQSRTRGADDFAHLLAEGDAYAACNLLPTRTRSSIPSNLYSAEPTPFKEHPYVSHGEENSAPIENHCLATGRLADSLFMHTHIQRKRKGPV